MFNSGVSYSLIADELGITKQAIARHVKNGMPIDSVGVAVGWYEANVRVRGRSRAGRRHSLPASMADWIAVDKSPKQPLALDDFDFWQGDPIEQIALASGDDSLSLHSAEAMLAFCDLLLHRVLSVIRLQVAQMPARLAHRSNPQRPALADQERDT